MRGVLIGDIIMAARAAMSVPPEAQDQLVADMLRDAHLADCARKRLGRGLVGRGEGALMSAATLRPLAPLPSRCTVEFLAAMRVVIDGITCWKARISDQNQ